MSLGRWLSLVTILLLLVGGCQDPLPQVVIYCSHDRAHAEKILRKFEEQNQIRVLAVYDTEANKTVGLAERLRREKVRPRCDVYWGNEPLRTIRLAGEGIFQPYRSPSAEGIAGVYRSSTDYWCGFAARLRALAYSPDRLSVEDLPASLDDLLEERWRGKVAIADPRFGTTSSHLAALRAVWGPQRYRDWLRRLRGNEVQVVASNSATRDRVLSGEAIIGFTDTDDIEVARRRGESIAPRFVSDGGNFLMPNTIALVKGAPNGERGKALIDYLLSVEIEEELAAAAARQIPLREKARVATGGLSLSSLDPIVVSLEEAASHLVEALREAEEALLDSPVGEHR